MLRTPWSPWVEMQLAHIEHRTNVQHCIQFSQIALNHFSVSCEILAEFLSWMGLWSNHKKLSEKRDSLCLFQCHPANCVNFQLEPYLQRGSKDRACFQPGRFLSLSFGRAIWTAVHIFSAIFLGTLPMATVGLLWQWKSLVWLIMLMLSPSSVLGTTHTSSFLMLILFPPWQSEVSKRIFCSNSSEQAILKKGWTPFLSTF